MAGNKDTRSGGKWSGNHTTLISLAAQAGDIAVTCPYVTSISPGYLTAGMGRGTSCQRVKIVNRKSGILLSVRQSGSHQEVHVLSRDIHQTMLRIARGLRDQGIQIAFGKH